MILNLISRGSCAAALIGISLVSPALAELPALQSKKWLGYFIGVENKKFEFGFTAQGKTQIRLYNKKGDLISTKLSIPIEFLVEETAPDGKISYRTIQEESLESEQPATEKPEAITIKAKTTGDATVEIYISEDRGVITLGGRLVDPGTLKNSPRFVGRIKIPDAYQDANKGVDKKEQKAFEEKSKDDQMQWMWTDGKRLKKDASESVDVGSPEINGPGISALQLEISTYQERKLMFSASENSMIKLVGEGNAPLNQGFTMLWIPDAAKDPQGKSRLTFEAK